MRGLKFIGIELIDVYDRSSSERVTICQLVLFLSIGSKSILVVHEMIFSILKVK